MKALTNRRTNAPKLSRLVRLKRISRRKRRERVSEEREIKVLAQQLIAGEVADRLQSERGLVKMTKKQYWLLMLGVSFSSSLLTSLMWWVWK